MVTIRENNSGVSSDIPMDIILQILQRLPVKSLIRFKLVCKTWYDLVENPDFIEEHRKRFTCNVLLVSNGLRSWTKRIFTLLHLGETFDNKNILNHVDLTRKFKCEVLGICNGLVCVETFNCCFDLELFICNPGIRHFYRISPLKLLEISCLWEIFGFGLQDDSYKLVRIVRTRREEPVWRCELYTMYTDTWKEIQMGDQPIGSFYQRNGTHVNGVIYWKANFSEGDRDEAVALFDFGKEVFDVIKTPSNVKSCHWQLAEIKGELALIIQLEHRSLEMWVLNETSKTWTMRYEKRNIPTFSSPCEYYSTRVEVLGCIRNNELLLKDEAFAKNILSLDMSSGETKVIQDIDSMEVTDSYLYSESLVPVNECHETLKLTGGI